VKLGSLNAYNILIGKVKAVDGMGDIGMGRMIILKRIFKERSVNVDWFQFGAFIEIIFHKRWVIFYHLSDYQFHKRESAFMGLV
jgi:hypothetical protein